MTYEKNSDVRTIGDYINNNFELTLFYAALEKTGVIEELTGRDVITVFATSNSAYNAIGIYQASDFDALDRDSLSNALRYHILDGALVKSNVPVMSIDTKYATRSSKDMLISFGNTLAGITDAKPQTLYVNGVAVSYPDIVLANGVLHVLLDEIKYKEGTVQDYLSTRSEYSHFVAALKKFGYWDRLAEDGPWTIVAPNDQAFANAGITLEDIATMNPENYYKRLFGSYVFETRLFTNDLRVMLVEWGTYSMSIPVKEDELAYMGISIQAPWNVLVVDSYLIFGLYESTRINSVKMSPASKLNLLTDNGVIHDLPQLAILPNNAIINK